ncbi:MAG TPA: Na+/H+ antiporter NhaA, partial [Coriobacteriia bacterium]|nr:Na+/H+ antiporter NhaA [Coriobacteriia bacterium]
IYGVAWLGGIGFTMSLFIAGLAFRAGILQTEAKLAILVASVVAGIGGWLVLRGASAVDVTSD